MSIPLIENAPSRDDPDNFDVEADNLFPQMNAVIAAMNATAAGMTAAAAGGAFTFPYVFSTTTTDSDPGAGVLRFNSATQNATSVLRIDNSSSAGFDVTGALDAMDDSSSSVKGYLRLVKSADTTKYALFSVSAVTVMTGYRNVTVTPVQFSTPSPFAINDSLSMHFDRTGDNGSYTPGYLKVSHRVASGSGSSIPTTGLNTRTLNTVEVNTISGASLASDTVTLPAGTYEFYARAPAAGVVGHKLLLWDSTNGATVGIGSSANAPQATYDVTTDSEVTTRLVITATTNYQLKHFIQNTAGTSPRLGNAVTSGQVEVYSEMLIRKVA